MKLTRPLIVPLFAILATACASAGQQSAPASDAGAASPGPSPGSPPAAGFGEADAGAPPPATDPLPKTATDVTIAPEFAGAYSAFDLGEIAGVPGILQGCAVQYDAQDTLLISNYSGSGSTPTPDDGIYSVHLQRDKRGHVYAVDGSAHIVQSLIQPTSLVYGPGGGLFAALDTNSTVNQPIGFLQFPAGIAGKVSGLLPSAILPMGYADMVVSFAFVPSNLADPGGARVIYWDAGTGGGAGATYRWFELGTSYSGTTASFTSAVETAQLPNAPIGLAYVPAGSPVFPHTSLVIAEYSGVQAVAAYEVDPRGTPIPSTRRLVMSGKTFQGTHFEPATGDFLFASGTHLYSVRGFVPPPPLPSPK